MKKKIFAINCLSLNSFLSSETFPTSSSTPLPEHQTSETIKPNLMDLKATIINHNSNTNSKNPKLGSSNSNGMNFPNGSDYSIIIDDFQFEHEKKLKSFKYMLMSNEGEDAFQSLAIIDAIQRLGIEYHFQEEIDAILRSHYMIPITHNHSDIYEVSLRFRLLRQEGYYVSEGVFGIFKDKKGQFKQEIRDDIKGLMGLYEASQLRIEGEDILDEAADFSYEILNSWVTRLDYPQAKAVENTLKHPHYKSLPKFMAKSFMSNLLGPINGWNNELEELAEFDFKIVQSQHQQEILQISKWWRELGLSNGMKFARNQPLKWYIWSMTALTDPTLSHQRVHLVKPISFVYMIDDIFDVYGTLNDLTLFTEVVNRWDINATDQLPECMNICFKALNNFTNEISYKVYEQHGWNPVDFLRKKWGSLCNAFLVEAKWFASGNLPNAEEYLKNGIVSSGVHVVLVHLFFLLGEDLTKENVEFINGNPSIISSTAKILRLWDDLGSAKDENQDGHDGSYLECYLKDNQESSVENARNHVLQMISETWKQLNKACLFQNPFSPTFTKACLNVARMVPLMYSYDDNCHLPIIKNYINSLLCASVSI